MEKPESVVFISQRSGQFTYFDLQLDHPDWTGKKVLDFGGNVGNLLLDPKCVIRPEDYHCIDVIRDAVEQGQERHPRAHFVHFDRYNWPLNLEGTAGLAIPDLGLDFDMILAYSVFTHVPLAETHELVEQLEARLIPGGILAFTFIDPHFKSWPGSPYQENNLQWELDRAAKTTPTLDVDALMEQSRGSQWCTLVDRSELYVDRDGFQHDIARPGRRYDVYHTPEFMQRQFPHATIHPPVNGEMQHCCVIRRPA